ncbi:MAG: hypothetical protein ACOYK7_01075 [Pirellulales bacterium]
MTTGTPLLVVAAPVIGLAAACGSHLILARPLGGRSPYQALAAGIGVGLVVALACTIVPLAAGATPTADTLALVALNTFAFLAFAFGYFNFVNLTIASLRIRMLEEIRAAARPLSRTDLLARYDTERVVGLRIERLVSGGHLVDRDGRLVSGRLRFLIVARFFESLRRGILGRHAGAPPTAPGAAS